MLPAVQQLPDEYRQPSAVLQTVVAMEVVVAAAAAAGVAAASQVRQGAGQAWWEVGGLERAGRRSEDV